VQGVRPITQAGQQGWKIRALPHDGRPSCSPGPHRLASLDDLPRLAAAPGLASSWYPWTSRTSCMVASPAPAVTCATGFPCRQASTSVAGARPCDLGTTSRQPLPMVEASRYRLTLTDCPGSTPSRSRCQGTGAPTPGILTTAAHTVGYARSPSASVARMRNEPPANSRGIADNPGCCSRRWRYPSVQKPVLVTTLVSRARRRHRSSAGGSAGAGARGEASKR
jgi:hypothetical protein